ncbi:MAG: hypothetical protein EU530_10260 [Promethearchaeota archaeon]|nr:MAG: hypothetical protein EU530_10260 [Candidatus Lokiarchaeota archaeon]
MSEEVVEAPNKGKERRKNRIRFEWLDQFRGIVIVLFIVQTFAYMFSDIIALPPMVNHGYKYINFGDGVPKIITLIDLGQSIFIFLVGFMQAFTVMKRFQKTDSRWKVLGHVAFRALLVWVLAFLHWLIAEILDDSPGINFSGWKGFVYTGTLAVIALSGLIAGIVALIFKNGDVRFWLGFGLMICTTVLWYLIENQYWLPNPPYAIVGGEIVYASFERLPDILSSLGHVEVAIIGGAIAGWVLNADGTINDENWKKRVLPLAFGFMTLSFVSWFIQWADHHKANMSLTTMTIGFSAFMIFAFYKMQKVNFRIPILSPLGKNMLLVFLLSMVINEVVYADMVLKNFDLIGMGGWYGPILDLILAGVVPIMLMWAIVYPLHKYNIIIKISWPIRSKN